jgi:hypothetical protein
MPTREEMFTERRTFPIRWYDLVTFDRDWLRDKCVVMYEDIDGVRKPIVLDSCGRQVYPLTKP